MWAHSRTQPLPIGHGILQQQPVLTRSAPLSFMMPVAAPFYPQQAVQHSAFGVAYASYGSELVRS